MGTWLRQSHHNNCPSNGNNYQQDMVLVAVLMVAAAAVAPAWGEAAPVGVPDFSQCKIITDVNPLERSQQLSLNCCLPVVPPHKIVDFSFERYGARNIDGRPRVRRAAHRATAAEIARYKKAYELMKALPAEDPRSFEAQAKIHCAFCEGAFMQARNSNIALQVHFSWLFLPWHRLYMFFHERILASLLGDPEFTLVFWNWDNQIGGGNVIPPMFNDPSSPLYDHKRSSLHAPPSITRLSPFFTTTDDDLLVAQNLNTLYQSLVTSSTAELFMGGPYRIGIDLSNSTVINAPLGGTMENGPHNAMHFWTGDNELPLGQDMATFSTAAFDPIFYAHHSNIDRIWEVWRYHMPGGQRDVHSDPNFLNAEFGFYDEDANLVKVKVSDSLDLVKLGYAYDYAIEDQLWINFSPMVVSSYSNDNVTNPNGIYYDQKHYNTPIEIKEKQTIYMKRPKYMVSNNESLEVLVINDVEVHQTTKMAELVVFVNLPEANASTSAATAEYVGSMTLLSSPRHRHLMTSFKFEIGDNLRRIGIPDDGVVPITILAIGIPSITIGHMEITYQ